MKDKVLKGLISLLFFLLIFTSKVCYASTDTDLKDIVLNQEGMLPNFNKDNLNYYISVKETIDFLNIKATPEDTDSSVSIEGNENLKLGDNNIKIKVTSKQGESKVYNIIVTKTNNSATSNSYLQNIILQNLELTPNFTKQIFDYNAGTIASDINEILVFAAAEDEKANVEIYGNKDLKPGSNIITIKCISEDKLTQKEYKVIVEKYANKTNQDLSKESVNATDNDNKKYNNNDNKHILLYSIISFLALLNIVQIFIYLKIKKHK